MDEYEKARFTSYAEMNVYNNICTNMFSKKLSQLTTEYNNF